MPIMEHRFCLKHIYENYKQKFKGIEYKKLLRAAASAGTEKHFEIHMGRMKEKDENSYRWYMQHDPHICARCHFSTHTKSDAIQNNICESFNSYIRKARSLPILRMFEWIMKKLMQRFYVKLSGMKNYNGNIFHN